MQKTLAMNDRWRSACTIGRVPPRNPQSLRRTMTMILHRGRNSRGSGRWKWSVESLEDRVVLSGEITEFPVVTMPPGVFSGVDAIASGPDGKVWFTNRGQNEIGSIDAAGKVVTYALPNQAADP